MQAADPAALAIGLGLLAGPLGAALARRGRRLLGAGVAAAAGAALAWLAGSVGASELQTGARALFAAAAGGAAALGLPGLGLGLFRRRSFGSAYERSPFGGARAEARLPARCAGLRPSALLDAADRVRLESALCDAERKSGAELAIALVASAGEPGAARWRAAAWLAAAAAVLAAGLMPEPRAVLAAGAAGAAAGALLARAPRVRRLFTTEAELAARAARGALDAFANAGLLRAAGARGALVFAALAECRVVALADRGLPAPVAEAMASGTAESLAAGRALEGLIGALGQLGSRDGVATDADPAPAPRPHPIRVED
jgi:uncharacterized membrane protein